MARSTYILSKCDLSIYRQLLQPFICLHHKNWWFLQIKRWYTFLKYKTSPGSFWEFFSDGLLSDVNLPATGQSLSLRNLIRFENIMSSFFLSLWLITSLLFSETTTRHHVDVDGEYLALDILDTAGKVNIPDPFMSPDYSQLSPCGHTAITNTPIIRTTAKSQCKNELQIFDWNKLPLMRTLNRVPSMSAVKWVNCKWSAFCQ